MTDSKKLVMTLAALAISLETRAAAAASTPTFVSGPAVVSHNTSSFANLGSMIFGYYQKFSGRALVAYVDAGSFDAQGTIWMEHFAPTFGVGWDGDPGAAYLNPSSHDTLTCGHAAASPGHMYCAQGRLGRGTYESELPVQVGTRTFNAGSTPALVSVQNVFDSGWTTWIFARGQDGQIWYAARDQATHSQPGDAYHGWWQMPAPASGLFTTDPAVATYTSDGLLIVCARIGLNFQYSCNKQAWGPQGSKPWSGWVTATSLSASSYRPGLTMTGTSVHLFAIAPSGSGATSSFPLGGGNWSGVTAFGGITFSSGPALAGTTVSGTNGVIAVARRSSDSTFWYATRSSGWGTFVKLRSDPASDGGP